MANRTGLLTAAHGNPRVIASLQNLTSSAPALITALITSLNSTSYLPAHYLDKPTLLAGYAAQLRLLTRSLRDGTALLTEFAWSGGGPGIGAALEKPLSRGTVLIASTDPHPGRSPPRVDFNALAHPFDARIAVLAFRLLRRVLLTAPAVGVLQVEELVPGQAVRMDEEVEGC